MYEHIPQCAANRRDTKCIQPKMANNAAKETHTTTDREPRRENNVLTKIMRISATQIAYYQN